MNAQAAGPANTRVDGGLVRAFNANKTSWVGLAIFGAIVLLAIAAPLISPYDPAEQHLTSRLRPPSTEFWFGTDSFGRDVLSRILWGARVSLSVGVCATLLGMLVGSAIGIVAGYRGGIVDILAMRVVDVLLCVPVLILGLLVVAMLGPSLPNLIFGIALGLVPKFARIARAPVIAVKERDFIQACRALGYSDTRIILLHIVPNVFGDILVMASLWTAHAILLEAALSFIGLGVKPPTPSWGGMLGRALELLYEAPWLTVYPGLAIMLTVFSVNLLGDGLRDAIDPKLRYE
jgi:peptide/nickel transport system permease protein